MTSALNVLYFLPTSVWRAESPAPPLAEGRHQPWCKQHTLTSNTTAVRPQRRWLPGGYPRGLLTLRTRPFLHDRCKRREYIKPPVPQTHLKEGLCSGCPLHPFPCLPCSMPPSQHLRSLKCHVQCPLPCETSPTSLSLYSVLSILPSEPGALRTVFRTTSLSLPSSTLPTRHGAHGGHRPSPVPLCQKGAHHPWRATRHPAERAPERLCWGLRGAGSE